MEDMTTTAPTADGGAAGAHNAQEAQTYRFAFTGETGAYFRIWLVNLLLTIATLGIYSAWAKVRTRRYFYGNTALDGATFDYHAKPLSILISRLIVVAFLVTGQVLASDALSFSYAVYFLLFALLLPWAVVRGLAFNARYSSYRNARFSFNTGAASYMSAYLIFAPLVLSGITGIAVALDSSPMSEAELTAAIQEGNWPLFAIANVAFYLIVFLAFPWLLRAYHGFKARNHSWGGLRTGFSRPSIGKYIGVIWLPLALFVAFLAVLFIVIFIVVAALGLGSEGGAQIGGVLGALAGVLAYLLAIIVAVAMAFHNYWNNITLPDGGRMECRFSRSRFAISILLVNSLAIIFSLGLLSPWAKIRRARFLAENMALVMPAAAFERALASNAKEESALGAEAGDMEGFDFDVGLI